MKKIFILFCGFWGSFNLNAQNLDSLLSAESSPEINYTHATFKSTRVINFQSVEQLRKKNLDFRIHHRFGPVNSGAYNFWGLDQGTIFMSFEYGITDWAEVGIGRSSSEKTFNAFGKFRILRQSSGAREIPVSVSGFFSTDLVSMKRTDINLNTVDRLSYVYQILIARKYNENFSFQIAPTLIHKNLVPTALDYNDIFAIGAGGRMKLTRRTSLNAEYSYAYRPNYIGMTSVSNNFSIGFDIETGGHVFQVMLTNTSGMIERKFITESNGTWLKGNSTLGFNISRTFSIQK